MQLLDRLLGRGKRKPSQASQLGSIEVAAPSTLSQGATNVPGATVHLTAPQAADLFVTAVSSNPGALAVTGGGFTVLAGASSGQVTVSVLAAGVSVPITVSLGAQTLQATIVTGSPPA